MSQSTLVSLAAEFKKAGSFAPKPGAWADRVGLEGEVRQQLYAVESGCVQWNLQTFSEPLELRGLHKEYFSSIPFFGRLVAHRPPGFRGSFGTMLASFPSSSARRRPWTLLAAGFVLALGVLQSTHAVAQDQRGTAPDRTSNPAVANGNYYALVIGINDYPEPLHKLKTAVNDANAVGKLLQSRYGFQVQYLFDQDATRFKILSALSQFRQKLKEDDNLLIYYGGHSYIDKETDRAYWMPIDADSGSSPNTIMADDLTSLIRALPSRHVLVVSDSCYSGGLSRDVPGRTGSDPALIARELRSISRTLMASGGLEPVADSGESGYSIFASAILRALGQAQDSMFTAMDLFYSSVRLRIAANLPQLPEYAVIRNSNDEGGDFVFELKDVQGRFRIAPSDPLPSYPAPVASHLPPEPVKGFSRDAAITTGSKNIPIPHNYALIFAVDDYLFWKPLANPIPDANTLNQTLTSLYSFEVEEVRNPTSQQILAKLQEYLHKQYQPQDQLLIAFSGHGYFADDLGQGYFVPADARQISDDPIHQSLLAHQQILTYVNRIPALHVLLVIDACFAGTLDRRIAESALRGDDSLDVYTHATLPELLQRKEPKRTRRYFASGGKDFVPDGRPGHHSPFMAALLVALNQAADRKGYATLDDIQLGLNTVLPEPRWGDIQDENEPGADFILLTADAVQKLAQPQ